MGVAVPLCLKATCCSLFGVVVHIKTFESLWHSMHICIYLQIYICMSEHAYMHLTSLLPQILALFLFLISNKAILLKKRKASLRT
jgi:hypothetical protein